MKPKKLRCYLKCITSQEWFAACITLNLCGAGGSKYEAIKSLHSNIQCYLQTVKDIKERNIPYSDLLNRPSPLFMHLDYIKSIFQLGCRFNMYLIQKEYTEFYVF